MMDAGSLAGPLIEAPEALAPSERVLVGYHQHDTAVLRHVRPGASLDQVLAEYAADPTVRYAEPDFRVQSAAYSNDPYGGYSWGLHNTGQEGGLEDADIDAPEVWDTIRSSMSTVVGIIDSGIDYQHPDLYRNVWINQWEIPSTARSLLVDLDGDKLITFRDLNDPVNQGLGKISDLNRNGYIDGGDLLFSATAGGWADGVSNDGDKYVDDLIGWNFVKNSNDPFDDDGHGTHVAGTIGAEGNNGRGVAGVLWDVQLVGLKFLDGTGGGYVSAAVEALRYAVSKSIMVTNNSWGGGGYSQALYDAIDAARTQGHIFVAAAGNGGADQIGDDNDAVANYPSSYGLDNIIAVAATDRYDNLAAFSNYGATSVDIAAPGVDILSTLPGGYGFASGTSMAAPHAAGVVAMLQSLNPSSTYTQTVAQLLNGADTVAQLAGKVLTGARLNAGQAVTANNAVILVSQTGGATAVAENGAVAQESDSIDVVLQAAPLTDVVVDISSSDAGEMVVSPQRLVFSPSNWNVPQTVVVQGVNDNVADGHQAITLRLAVDDAASDDLYDGAADVTVAAQVYDVPVAPDVTGPVGSGQPAQPTITFTNLAGATSYNLWLVNLESGLKAHANDAIAPASGTTTSYTVPVILADGPYRAFISANNGYGFSNWDYGDFSVGGTQAIPAAPGGFAVDQSANPPTVSWTPSPNASYYNVWMVRLSDSTAYSGRVTRAAYTASSVLPTGAYRMFVNAGNASGISGWSAPYDFFVGASTPPAAPSGFTLGGSPLSVQWAAVATATYYDAWLVRLSDGQHVPTPRVTSPALDVSSLAIGSYRVFVRAGNAAGSSSWAGPYDFAVSASPVAASLATSSQAAPAARPENLDFEGALRPSDRRATADDPSRRSETRRVAAAARRGAGGENRQAQQSATGDDQGRRTAATRWLAEAVDAAIADSGDAWRFLDTDV